MTFRTVGVKYCSLLLSVLYVLCVYACAFCVCVFFFVCKMPHGSHLCVFVCRVLQTSVIFRQYATNYSSVEIKTLSIHFQWPIITVVQQQLYPVSPEHFSLYLVRDEIERKITWFLRWSRSYGKHMVFSLKRKSHENSRCSLLQLRLTPSIKTPSEIT